MDWLEAFCDKYSKFYDDDFIFSDRLNKEDSENVKKLRYFYELIREYAKNYFIVGNNNDDIFNSYNIKYNDNYYVIGFIIDSIYCKKEDTVGEKYINFSDIMRFQKNKNLNHKKEIKYLEYVLHYLLECGLTSKQIQEETKKYLRIKK